MRFFLSIAFLALCSCSAQLRAPVCPKGAVDFPSEFAGVYEVTVPKQDLSGGFALSKIKFYLGPDKIALPSAAVLKFSNEPNSSITVSSQFDLKQIMAICKIEDSYFIQTKTDQDHYSLMRADFASQGITMTSMTVDQKALKNAGISTFNFPSFEYLRRDDKSGSFLSPFIDGSSSYLVVDNSHIGAEVMKSYLQPSPFGVLLNRVEESSAEFFESEVLSVYSFSQL